jgi:hypothetical protein
MLVKLERFYRKTKYFYVFEKTNLQKVKWLSKVEPIREEIMGQHAWHSSN